MIGQRSLVIEDLSHYHHLPDDLYISHAKLIGELRIKKDLDSTRKRYFEGQLAAMEKEDERKRQRRQTRHNRAASRQRNEWPSTAGKT